MNVFDQRKMAATGFSEFEDAKYKKTSICFQVNFNNLI